MWNHAPHVDGEVVLGDLLGCSRAFVAVPIKNGANPSRARSSDDRGQSRVSSPGALALSVDFGRWGQAEKT